MVPKMGSIEEQQPPSNSKVSSHLANLQRDGFVIVPSLLPYHLLVALQAASKYTTERARLGKWPSVRTVPKQYPPWKPFQPGDNIWGVQHLLHPDMWVRDVFAEVYFSDSVLNVVKELLGDVSDGDLVMELFNLLVSPGEGVDFELQWHRDDIRPDVDEAEEERLLREKVPEGRQLHAQYNIALFEDESLIVVPGSHRRVRTNEERNADPYEKDMPGQIFVKLKPGDAVYYDSNILHRGTYKGIDTSKELGRMTLHGSVGLAGHGNERARQVLQHAVGEWVDRAQFSLEGEKGRRAEAMRKKLVEMGRGEDVGYSLEG
jgi:hypothetical protein